MDRDDGQRRDRVSETRFRSVFLQAPIGIALYDLDGRILDANPPYLELLGAASVEDLRNLSLFEDPDLSEEDKERLRKGEAVQYRSDLDFELLRRRGICPNATPPRAVLECSVARLMLEGSEPPVYVRRVLEVTERAEAEERLHETRLMLELVLDTIPQRVFWKDRQFRYLGCNLPFAHDAYLESPEQIVGKEDFDLSWKESAELYRADDRFVMESGVPKLNYEEPQAGPGGSMLWLRTSKVPLRDRAGNVIGVLGTYEDITAKKRAELERENLVVELQRALSKVKTLSGLLPMCAACKKIRDDTGYWRQVEEYLAHHGDFTFSHGICPDCMTRIYPEYRKKK